MESGKQIDASPYKVRKGAKKERGNGEFFTCFILIRGPLKY